MVRDLAHALNLAAKIRREEGYEDFDPISICTDCGEDTFYSTGVSDDGAVEMGKCLHCGKSLDYDGAMDEALAKKLKQHEND